jgi:hypothetical protein
MKIKRRKPTELAKQARRGFRGYPVATGALYGPTAERATKVSVGIVEQAGKEPEILERWHCEEGDIRQDEEVSHEIVRFIRSYHALSVVMVDRIIGCPHEEGIDYPDGEVCQECPYWHGRDRWSGETIN